MRYSSIFVSDSIKIESGRVEEISQDFELCATDAATSQEFSIWRFSRNDLKVVQWFLDENRNENQ